MPEDIEAILAKLGEAARCGDQEAVATHGAELLSATRSFTPEDPAQFVTKLRAAVDAFDRKLVAELCDALVEMLWRRDEVFPLPEAKAILGTLRRKRHFDEMVTVAEVLIQSGQDAPRIRRQYGQALLDRKQIAAARAVLEALKAECEQDAVANAEELEEAIGLIGRAHKQVYMDSAGSGGTQAFRQRSLEQAVASYARVFLHDQANIWHGINAVALLDRAKRDGINLDPAPLAPRETAEAIRANITAMKNPGIWELSTAGEACLALEDYAGALQWIVKYTACEQGDAFEFASTLRQFEEVWNLQDRDPAHAKILNALRGAVLTREGGALSLANPAAQIAAASNLLEDKTYEAVLGETRYQSYKLLVKGLKQARMVARIETRAGNGHGTGFLFPGALIHQRLAGEWVLITNAHVISLDPVEQRGAPGALAPDEARVRFEAWDTPEETYRLDQILFSSPRTVLDCSIVRLRPQPDFQHEFDLPKRLPCADGRQRVYVIGHPRGESLSVSLQDNLLLDHEAPKIHYRAPTEGGSSGSPVFSSAWDLIGLHHAGGSGMRMLHEKHGTYSANEGIWIHAVRKAAGAALGG